MGERKPVGERKEESCGREKRGSRWEREERKLVGEQVLRNSYSECRMVEMGQAKQRWKADVTLEKAALSV